jgi:hypothetical protein
MTEQHSIYLIYASSITSSMRYLDSRTYEFFNMPRPWGIQRLIIREIEER